MFLIIVCRLYLSSQRLVVGETHGALMMASSSDKMLSPEVMIVSNITWVRYCNVSAQLLTHLFTSWAFPFRNGIKLIPVRGHFEPSSHCSSLLQQTQQQCVLFNFHWNNFSACSSTLCSKKEATKLLAITFSITFSNLSRSSKFFHCWKEDEISNKTA